MPIDGRSAILITFCRCNNLFNDFRVPLEAFFVQIKLLIGTLLTDCPNCVGAFLVLYFSRNHLVQRVGLKSNIELERVSRWTFQDLKVAVFKSSRNGKVVVTLALLVTFAVGLAEIFKFGITIFFEIFHSKAITCKAKRQFKSKEALHVGAQNDFSLTRLAFDKVPH